ncbi:MAG: arsenate reductase ArsC [Pseudomonadota bacterium]|nr:arsenate reductase ArsC [Pseudomonadota bacterium]MDE3037153.1 arsenate reductase ArsC [Pseudomonadota bacterium]
MQKTKKVLFLCSGNSCRSIMAEGMLNHFGKDRFVAYSAGSFPTGTVHPMAVDTLNAKGIAITGYRSKSWNEFSGKPIDIAITLCNQAAGEACPIFTGKPIKAHWDVPDPSQIQGSGRKAGFDAVYGILEPRIKALLRLPMEQMSREEISEKLRQIDTMAA